jgi:anthranilate 1,2-dioxygenase large subunit
MNAPEHRIPDISWPRNDYSRVPFRVHHDEEIYALEMERIFRGPTWSYLCLEAEIPNPGDFRTTWVGDTPVIVTRDKQGGLNAFVNRCSHKGAMISRHLRGNTERLVCLYHRWTYNHKGDLTGLPFRQGLKGEGGMPKDFDMQAVSPRKLKAQSLSGMIFGTFQPEKAEPLEDYLGEFGTGLVKRFFHKPIRILGYSRQKIAGNWKLYAENLRDTYHASLLHEFFVTYGVDRATQKGGVKMDGRHRHNMNHAYAASDTAEDAKAAYADTAARLDRMKLRDTKLLQYTSEFPDGMNLSARARSARKASMRTRCSRPCSATRTTATRWCATASSPPTWSDPPAWSAWKTAKPSRSCRRPRAAPRIPTPSSRWAAAAR